MKWSKKKIVLLILVVVLVPVGLMRSCEARERAYRSPEAQQERIKDIEPRLIRDSEGNVIGLRAE